MAIYTPRGLKIRLSLQWTFGLLGRLWKVDRSTDAFRVLKTCEAIDHIPAVLAYACGLAVAVLAPHQSWAIVVARPVAAVLGVLLTQMGAFAVLRPAGILAAGRAWSWISGYGVLFLVAGGVVYAVAGWPGVAFWLAGGIAAFFAGETVGARMARARYGRLDDSLTSAEVNFFNAYRLHADQLGLTRNLLLEDGEQKSETWLECLVDYAKNYPAAVRRFGRSKIQEYLSRHKIASTDSGTAPAEVSEPAQMRVRVHLLNPACGLMPPVFPLPEWVDPDLYSVKEWEVGCDVSADTVRDWLDPETGELFAIRMLKLSERRYVEPQFVTRIEWEQQAKHHNVERETALIATECPSEAGTSREAEMENAWLGGKVHLVFPPLAPELLGKSGALFQNYVFSPDVGRETALFLLEDRDFARQIGKLKPFNLAANSGVAYTSAGAVAFILWSVSSRNGHVVDYEHLLSPFDVGTRERLWAASRQEFLKVIIREFDHGETEGFLQFKNIYDLDVLASMCDQVAQTEPAAELKETRAALTAEYSLEDLRNAGLPVGEPTDAPASTEPR